MISPNATSPSVTSISRWYSTGATDSPRRRRRAGAASVASAANRHLGGQPAEGLAALLVVAELVERGAGGREQHDIAGAGLGGGARHRARQVAAAGVGHRACVE